MTDVRVVLGIDPGLSGAIARLTPHPDQSMGMWDMPTVEVMRNGKAKRQVDLALLLQIIREAQATEVWLESVSARPGESPVAAFAFGRGFGAIECAVVAAGLPVTYVAPAHWKRLMSVGKGKDASRLRASQILPMCSCYWRRAKDDGRAEAALIAAYGLLYGGRQ